jgi:hypothetical protein
VKYQILAAISLLLTSTMGLAHTYNPPQKLTVCNQSSKVYNVDLAYSSHVNMGGFQAQDLAPGSCTSAVTTNITLHYGGNFGKAYGGEYTLKFASVKDGYWEDFDVAGHVPRSSDPDSIIYSIPHYGNAPYCMTYSIGNENFTSTERVVHNSSSPLPDLVVTLHGQGTC